jgi:hypothetical protein
MHFFTKEIAVNDFIPRWIGRSTYKDEVTGGPFRQ